MTDPTGADIEANKQVRAARAAGCTCIWAWQDNGQGDGGTEPGIETRDPNCPVHPPEQGLGE